MPRQATRAVNGGKAAWKRRRASSPRSWLCRLTLRMTWRPADAEDATQGIVIRVVTGLASWRG